MRQNTNILLLLLLLAACALASSSSGRDVVALSQWAKEEGIKMHKNLQWKEYGEGDWGLVLTAPVPRGTVLLQVPRSLVLDSTVLKQKQDSATCQKVLEALGNFALHEENFWIVLELYKLKCGDNKRWAPWLAGMPSSFPEFTPAELDCLPFYAKYAADYQDQKLEAFLRAAEALEADVNPQALKWAFRAVNSRFWKNYPTDEDPQHSKTPGSELVPIGDMFNHRDPPNVQMVPADTDHVTFGYLGDDAQEDDGSDNYERDLFLTYGLPGNPHRFLAIFGFVPTAQSMPHVWSHIIYGDTNPYSKQVDKMTFGALDGAIAPLVWDAILWELLEVPLSEQANFEATKEQKHIQYKSYTKDLLDSHLTRQLEELTALRAKIEATEGPNIELIRQHNEFLTSVFAKVKENLDQSPSA